MHHDSKLTFFRQSSWLIIANTVSGVFMALVHPIASALLPASEYALFFALLRFFVLLTIPSAGLQIVFAQQAAAAIDRDKQLELAGTARAIFAGTIGIWLLTAGGVALFQDTIIASFKITDPRALWLTLGVVLLALWLPLLQGILQGEQTFAWLGWSMMLNGLGRVVPLFLIVYFASRTATGAMTGALIGVATAVLACLWPLRTLLKTRGHALQLGPWLRRVVPLTLGIGSIIFVMNADMLVVQSHFADPSLYTPPAMLGVALVLFTTPLAAVMFPKIVRSAARAEKSNAFLYALAPTAILGCGAAVFCTFFPEIPVRLLFFRAPHLWPAAALLPWITWCMLPVTLSNVLVVDLLARGRVRAVPWLVLVAGGYGVTLLAYVHRAKSLPELEAFRSIIQILGVFSALLFVVAFWFSWRSRLPGQSRA